MSQEDPFYKLALKNADSIESPSIGFSVSNTNLNIGLKTLTRQNNTLIELCVQLNQRILALETRVKSLETQKFQVPDDLITNLKNLSLDSTKKKPVEAKGLIRVRGTTPQEALKGEVQKWEARK